MKTLVHLSIDDGPVRSIVMGRALTEAEKFRLKQAVAGFVRTLQVWMDAEDKNERMRAPTRPDSEATATKGRGVG